jgi:hypothetical protein
MKYGFVFPYGGPRQAAEFAYAAEQAGWDGFFVWEPVWGFDAWILLAAAAMRTEYIRLGTLISPISRMRPWKLASETVTLDHLSGGRLILSVGLGAVDTGFEAFNEVTDRKTRAELLDESLDILTGLWRGQPFSYKGQHYQVQPTEFFPPPPPLQQPRIPIWVVGAWPRLKSMRRALRYEGLLPNVFDNQGKNRDLTPADVEEIHAYVQQNRSPGTPFDIVVEGVTPAGNRQAGASQVDEWARAGATWWIEALWEAIEQPNGPQRALERVEQGPPRSE